MKNLRNTVQLIGNVGQVPELITFESGKKMAKFSLATNESFTNAQNEKVEQTYWHNIIVWGKQAEYMAENITKGQQLLIEGKLTNRSYEDKDDNKKFITEIILNEFIFLGTKPKTETKPF